MRAAAALALVLLAAGCGAQPQRAVGISAGPTAHYLLCGSGPPARTVRLQPRPLPFVLRTPAGEPAMEVTRIPARGILRGDGETVTAAQFLDGRDAYCNAGRQDRAAAIAAGFAGLVLVLLYLRRRRRIRAAYR